MRKDAPGLREMNWWLGGGWGEGGGVGGQTSLSSSGRLGASFHHHPRREERRGGGRERELEEEEEGGEGRHVYLQGGETLSFDVPPTTSSTSTRLLSLWLFGQTRREGRLIARAAQTLADKQRPPGDFY